MDTASSGSDDSRKASEPEFAYMCFRRNSTLPTTLVSYRVAAGSATTTARRGLDPARVHARPRAITGRKCVGTSSPRPPDRILLTDRASLIRAQHQDARCHPDTRAHVRREHAFDARGAPCYYATRAHATWRRLAAAVWPASTIQPGHQQGCRAVHPLECCPAGCEQFLASLRCRRQLCNCRWRVRLCQWRGASGGMLTGCAVQLQAKCAATTTFATRDSGDTIRRPPRLVAGLRSPPPARLPRFATSSPSRLVFDLATGWQAQLYHVRVRGFGRGNCSIVCA